MLIRTVMGQGSVSAKAGELCLLVRVGKQLYALPLDHVVETMRLLPVSAVAGAPSFVRGVAVIRGLPVPVVDAASILSDGDEPFSVTRLVALRIGDRRVALGVREVVGVRHIAAEQLADLPPLLATAREHVVTGIGTLDSELLMVLRSGKLVPEDAWAAIDAVETR